MRAALLVAAAALALVQRGVPAFADDGDAPPADPGVARISVVQGGVTVRRADDTDTYAAALNEPVSAGDYLLTQPSGRGEVEFDFGSSLRVAPDTQLRFTDVDPHLHRLQLAAGTVLLRVFRGLAAHPEIQTPAATIRPLGNGAIRVTVTADGNTIVAVRAGRAQVVTGADTRTLAAGPALLVAGDPSAPDEETIDPVPLDAFDTFNQSRDAYEERAHDWAYVDAGIVGADDLDAYGSWTDVDGYGDVWRPAVEPAGWAPYTTGRWVWEPYYGWAWVDDAPWGYAPYHYGRWFYAGGAWYWAPGIAVAGPVAYGGPIFVAPQPVFYRPALVAFFAFGSGGGGGFGFGLGFANVGWCALAPAEPYRPWYGRGATTAVAVNVNVNITNAYRNAGAPGGAVAVSGANFASGNFTRIAAVPHAALANVAPVRGLVPVVPTKANLAFNGRAPQPLAAGAAGAASQTRFARFATQPHVVAPSFVQQQSIVRAAASKAIEPLQPHTPAAALPAYARPSSPEGTATAKPAAAPAGADPFSRFDRGATSAPYRAPATAAPYRAPATAAPYRAPVTAAPYATPAYAVPPTYRTAAPLAPAPKPPHKKTRPAATPSGHVP
jgi:hypothetical protein